MNVNPFQGSAIPKNITIYCFHGARDTDGSKIIAFLEGRCPDFGYSFRNHKTRNITHKKCLSADLANRTWNIDGPELGATAESSVSNIFCVCQTDSGKASTVPKSTNAYISNWDGNTGNTAVPIKSITSQIVETFGKNYIS